MFVHFTSALGLLWLGRAPGRLLLGGRRLGKADLCHRDGIQRLVDALASSVLAIRIEQLRRSSLALWDVGHSWQVNGDLPQRSAGVHVQGALLLQPFHLRHQWM